MAESKGDSELIEEIHERRLAGILESGLAQQWKKFREGDAVVERAVGLAGGDAITFGEVLEPPAGGVQRSGEGQRVVRREVRSARELRRHSSQDRKVERVAVVRDEDVRAAESTELGPHRLEVR